MTLRNLARLGLAGVLAISALGLAVTPALAADLDVGLRVSGSTIAADASGKSAKLSITNHGTTKPASIVVVFDATKLDSKKVALSIPHEECATENGITSCQLKSYSIPAPGGSSRIFAPLGKVAGATGAAGRLTITLKAEGDTVEANDSRTVDVTVGGGGADLGVFAQDVTWQTEGGLITDKPVPPGALAPLSVYVVNQGDMTATGVKIQLTLPKQVTFSRQYDACEVSADKRMATCRLDQFNLVPTDEDPSGVRSGMHFSFEVLVSPDAKGPVSLAGGKAAATAIEQTAFSAGQRSANVELPKHVSWLTADQLAKIDADMTDNADKFVVFVAAPAGGNGGGGNGGGGNGGGGNGNGGGGNNGGGNGGQGGGELPITGPAAFGLGGGGLAVVALGLVLFVAARRRRVVLVTPGDEK